MEYDEAAKKFLEQGFTRVERDDRLLDIFTKETLEKGVELWERWQPLAVNILRVRLPFAEKNIRHFTLDRQQLENNLLTNQPQNLEEKNLT